MADGAVEDAATMKFMDSLSLTVPRQNTAGLELAGREGSPFFHRARFIIFILNRKELEWDAIAGSVAASGQTSSFPARATEFMSANTARGCQRANAGP
jgi:hypothetical protein